MFHCIGRLQTALTSVETHSHLHTDKGVTLLVPIDIVGIDVVCVGVIIVSPQDDSGVIVTKNIRVAILKRV